MGKRDKLSKKMPKSAFIITIGASECCRNDNEGESKREKDGIGLPWVQLFGEVTR